MQDIATASKTAEFPLPLDIALQADTRPELVFGCNEKIMQRNLKLLQAQKYEVDGIKLYPYKNLKLLMRSPSLPAHLQVKVGDSSSTSHMAILASFLQDKQLHKMLQTQVPMSVGATVFKDIVVKMNLDQFLRKQLLQTAYLEIAFLQTKNQEVKSQKLLQQDLEKKTIQSACTAFIRALPSELYSRYRFNKLLDSKSTTELENKMDKMAEIMQLKSPVTTDTIKEKFAAFLDEIKDPEFQWPIKYIIAQRITNALEQCWNSEEYLQYMNTLLGPVTPTLILPIMILLIHPRTPDLADSDTLRPGKPQKQ